MPGEDQQKNHMEEQLSKENIDKMNNRIESKVNPVRILVKKVLETDSTLIMIEGTKAIKNLSKTEEVIHMLQKE